MGDTAAPIRIEPMTLDNMRSLGIRSVLASCEKCPYEATFSVDACRAIYRPDVGSRLAVLEVRLDEHQSGTAIAMRNEQVETSKPPTKKPRGFAAIHAPSSKPCAISSGPVLSVK